MPSKASSNELQPKCSGSHRGRKGKRGKENPTKKLHVTYCLCFTFLMGSFMVMNHLQGIWSRLWSWMVSSWHCPHWTAENSRLSLERHRNGTATLAWTRTQNVGPLAT